MKNNWTFMEIFHLTILLVSILCVLFAFVMQFIVQIQVYGAVFKHITFVPHWSAWFFFGLIPMSYECYFR